MKYFLMFLTLLTALHLFAQSTVPLSKAIEETIADVVASTAELNALRDDIQNERLPLAAKLEDLRQEAVALRKQVETLRRAQGLRQQERADLAADVSRLEQEKEFIAFVFEEYRRSLETRVLPAEIQYLDKELPENQDAWWDWSLAWLTMKQNGYRFAAEVLDAEGKVLAGEIMVLGPTAYFVNDNTGGVVVSRPGSSLPGLYALPSKQGVLQAFAQGDVASLPLDVSGGDAMKVAEAKPGLIAHIQQGGVVVIPLLFLGALALLMSIRKAVDLQRLTVHIPSELREQLRNVDEQQATALIASLASQPQPVGGLIAAALQHRNASRTHLEEILHEHVLAVVPRLERSLGTLAVFGGVAPLLGLLGTVTGMIHTFQLVTLFGSGNAKTLSGGISEALVTTEVGLVIAIPILLVHAFLARKAKTLLGELEQSGLVLVNLLKSDDQPTA